MFCGTFSDDNNRFMSFDALRYISKYKHMARRKPQKHLSYLNKRLTDQNIVDYFL